MNLLYDLAELLLASGMLLAIGATLMVPGVWELPALGVAISAAGYLLDSCL